MNRELLEKPFEPTQIKQLKGRNGLLDYIEGHSVVHRLNQALDGAWSFEIAHHEVREDEVLILGKLTAEGITKMQFGVSQVTREKNGGALISLGDDLKAAASCSTRGRGCLAVFHAAQDPAVEIVDVQRRLTVPLIDQQTGEVLERELVVVMDLLERDREGHLVVVDLKTAARKYTELQVETSLQLTVYSYAAEMAGLADREEVRLRFDVLTKTKQPEFHRYPTSRDRRANVKLFRLASEVLRGVEAGVFHPIVGWQCKECQFRERCWAWG